MVREATAGPEGDLVIEHVPDPRRHGRRHDAHIGIEFLQEVQYRLHDAVVVVEDISAGEAGPFYQVGTDDRDRRHTRGPGALDRVMKDADPAPPCVLRLRAVEGDPPP